MNIEQVDYFLPEKYENIYQASKRLNIEPMQAKVFERMFGLKKIPLDSSLLVETMLLDVASRCLQNAGVTAQQVRWIIHSHTATHISPFGMSPVRYVQQMLNLNEATAFGMSMNKCGSVFVACELAEELLVGMNNDEFVLILIGDVTFTEILQFIPGTTVTSDGACAILLSKKGNKNKFLTAEIQTHGEFAGGIWGQKDTHQKFEKNYSRYLADVIQKVILKAGLKPDNIKYIFPHNVNVISWQQTAKLLNMPISQVFLNNVSETAHCFGSDPLINFKNSSDHGLLKRGDYFVLATVGLGATFGALVFQH